MRFLLISDTHGRLGVVGELADQVRADAVIHAGVKTPRWYRRMTHINLPGAHVGYAGLDIDEAGPKLQTFLK